MQAKSVDLKGWVELADLPGVTVSDTVAHERVRESRLADVMIVLERHAEAIAQAIGERVAMQWPKLREADVELTISEDKAEFQAHITAEQDPDSVAVDLPREAAALARIIEGEIAEAIGRRVSVNRRFEPRIQIEARTDHPSPAATVTTKPPSDDPVPKVAMPRHASIETTPAGRFWLLVLFALIAAMLFGAAYLITTQP